MLNEADSCTSSNGFNRRWLKTLSLVSQATDLMPMQNLLLVARDNECVLKTTESQMSTATSWGRMRWSTH